MRFTSAPVSLTAMRVPPIFTPELKGFNGSPGLSPVIWWYGAGTWESWSGRRRMSFSAFCARVQELTTMKLPIGPVGDTHVSIATLDEGCGAGAPPAGLLIQNSMRHI